MDFFMQAMHVVMVLDQHIGSLWADYGVWMYVIVFAIIFAETGIVIAPWLPGDSLLFVLGTLAAAGGPDVRVLMLLLFAAAVLGNTSNYWIGRFLGPRVFQGKVRWLSRDLLDKTHAFYDKHGAVTVMLSRFLPLLRTVAPFVAGIGAMPHGKFQWYSVLGGGLWIVLFVGGGFLFGQVPGVKDNLPLVILGVTVLSILPIVVQGLRGKFSRR